MHGRHVYKFYYNAGYSNTVYHYFGILYQRSLLAYTGKVVTCPYVSYVLQDMFTLHLSYNSTRAL